MTFVKICGLKEQAHVETAVESGVNFIGFMFAPSKRTISVEKAMELAKSVPVHVGKVGVFVNEAREVIEQIAKSVPLDYVQYHGDETPEFITEIGLPSIKAFSVRTKEDIEQAARYEVDYYLLDAPGTDFRGGSGQTFDWSLLAEANIPKDQVILAGGLRAENIVEAINLVQPFGVDVSSGVERDEQKDHELIREFILAAKGASKS